MKLHKFDSILSRVSIINDIEKDLSELRKNYEKRESDYIVTKQVNTKLRDQIKILECQCWTNEQYNRPECLGISGVSESVTDKDLEGKVIREKRTYWEKRILKFVLVILTLATG